MKIQKRLTVLLAVGFLFVAGACRGTDFGGGTEKLTASGTIAAEEISVAAEIGGAVAEVLVQEGDRVAAGDVLCRIDDALLKAQYAQAQAAGEAAGAAVALAQAQLESARLQYAQVLQGARLQDRQNRSSAWSLPSPVATVEGYRLPNWYFEKIEIITATQTEIEAAQAALEVELAKLAAELQNVGNADFVASEARLAAAQARYLAARDTLTQAQSAPNQTVLAGVAQEQLDLAASELKVAQMEYDRRLSSAAAEAVLKARARVAVARARLNNAQDALAQLQTGDQALSVAVARHGVIVAEQGVAQAEAGREQAEAALAALQLQLDKTTVRAPTAGVVLSRNLDVGEMIGVGVPVVVIGRLEQVRLTVYIPEDRYGQIELGQKVTVTVDSFPGKTYSGSVVHIADKAEFTPRNVQTKEGRKATVYAVKIVIPNPHNELKPGMPADVEFETK